MNRNVHLDNVVKSFVDNLDIDKPIYEMNSDDARRFLVKVQEDGYLDLKASVEDISIFNTLVGDISVRLVKPESCKDEILPLIVYCHGGGWVMGSRSLESADTKLKAAQMVTRFGGRMLIANGKIPYVIKKIFDGEEIGTMFLPQTEELSDKKRWIGYATNIIGQIVVNDGAKKALLAQKSLLPIGVCEVINEFNKGDVVSILDQNRNEIARGIVNYASDSCRRVIGCHSDNIMEILGFKNYDAIITRDNITLL